LDGAKHAFEPVLRFNTITDELIERFSAEKFAETHEA
jgi:hypothetical protein